MTRLFAFVALGAIAVAQADVRRTFDADAAGEPPPGFLFGTARDATPGRWLVEELDGNAVLAHVGDPARERGLAIAVLAGDRYRALEISARLKMAPGGGSGGLVWRYRDPENCYLVELDLERQDIGLYRLVRGNRIRLDREDDLELDPEAWHTVRVAHEGDTIRVHLGGVRVFRARDRTFRSAGRAGVWSAGGSTVYFDDLRVSVRSD